VKYAQSAEEANIAVLGLLSCGHSMLSLLSTFVVISIIEVFTYGHTT